MKMKRAFSVITMLVILVLGVTGCKKKVEGITLDKTELVVTHGETFVLNATVLPSDATDRSVYWTVFGPEVSPITDENTLQKEFLAAEVGEGWVHISSADHMQADDCFITILENEDDRVAREKEEKEAEGKKSDDGVNFSELTLIPDRGIITVKIENTTRVAKRGLVEIACLDEDGLQLKKSTINFDINALTDDIIQSNKIPSGTVSVKFLRTLVVDK